MYLNINLCNYKEKFKRKITNIEHNYSFSGHEYIVVGKFRDLCLTPFTSYHIHLLSSYLFLKDARELRTEGKQPLDSNFILGIFNYFVVMQEN